MFCVVDNKTMCLLIQDERNKCDQFTSNQTIIGKDHLHKAN